jgi:hypothetical protein
VFRVAFFKRAIVSDLHIHNDFAQSKRGRRAFPKLGKVRRPLSIFDMLFEFVPARGVERYLDVREIKPNRFQYALYQDTHQTLRTVMGFSP